MKLIKHLPLIFGSMLTIVGCSDNALSSTESLSESENQQPQLNLETVTGVLYGPEGDSIHTTYQIWNDSQIVIEGDIIVDTKPHESSIMLLKQAGSSDVSTIIHTRDITHNNKKWQNNVIPYVIDLGGDNAKQAMVETAIITWNNAVGDVIKWVPKTSAHTNYARFNNVNDCSTHIGAAVNRQVNVGSCNKAGSVMHEMGHVALLQHTHSRSDRDFKIDLIGGEDYQSTMVSYAQNFGPHGPSLMSYGIGNSWSVDKEINGKATEYRVQYLTESDLSALRSIYGKGSKGYDTSYKMSYGHFLEPIGNEGGAPLWAVGFSPAALPSGATVKYKVYNSIDGWSSTKQNNQWAYFQSRYPIEDIEIWIENAPGYAVKYRAYRKNYGWTSFEANGKNVMTQTSKKQISAIEFAFVASQVIRSQTGKCMDVYGGRTASTGQNIVIWDCHKKGSEQFDLQKIEDDAEKKIDHHKYRTMVQIKTLGGKCLEVNTSRSTVYSGDNVHTANCSADKMQYFYIDSENRIRSYANTSKCMDVNMGNDNIEMHGCHSGSNQKWYID